jgi:hypothetical protein
MNDKNELRRLILHVGIAYLNTSNLTHLHGHNSFIPSYKQNQIVTVSSNVKHDFVRFEHAK